MKIISVDSFDRELIGISDDKLLAENISESYGDCMVKALNDNFGGSHSSRFFRLVADDYELVRFEP